MSEHAHIAPLFSADEESCLSHAQMQAYAQGKLPEAEKHQVERHLLNCELCAMAYEGLAGMDAAEVEAATQDLTDRAWKRVAHLDRNRRRSAILWLSSAAAILLVIVTGFFLLDGPDSTKSLDQIADRMMEAEESTVAPEPTFADGSGLEKAEDSPNVELSGGDLEQRNAPPAPPQERAEDFIAMADDEPADFEVLEDADYDGASEMQFAIVEEVEEEAPEEEVDEIVIDAFAYNRNTNATAPKQEVPTTTSTEGIVFGGASDKGDVSPTEEKNMESGVGGVTTDLSSGGFLMATDSTASFDANGTIALNEQITNVRSDDVMAIPQMDDGVSSEYFESADLESVTISSASRRQAKVRSNRDRGVARSKQKRKTETAKDLSVADNKNAEPDVQGDVLDAEEEKEREVDYYQRGIRSFANQDYSSSARDLRQAAEDTPQNLNAHFYAARSFIEMEQYPAALYHLDRILNEQENSLTEDARWYKSVVMLRMGNKGSAQELLEEIEEQGGKRARKAKEILESDF